MSKRERTIEVIARGILFRRGKVLLCRNVGGGYVYLPGGHVEFGETAAEALAREFLEETGRVVRVWNLRGAHDQVFVQKGKKRHEVSLIYAVTLQGDAAVRSLEEDIAFEWASVPALKRMDLRPRAHEAIVRAALKHSRDQA